MYTAGQNNHHLHAQQPCPARGWSCPGLVHFTSPSSARAARQSRRDTTWPSGQALQMRAQSPGHARGANESKQRLRRAVASWAC